MEPGGDGLRHASDAGGKTEFVLQQRAGEIDGGAETVTIFHEHDNRIGIDCAQGVGCVGICFHGWHRVDGWGQ